MALESKGEAERRAKEFLKDALSDISHQLKTPLAALHMYNEIVLKEPENAEAVRQFSEKAAQALRRMEDLIGTLLKVMRLAAGSIPFEKELYSMGEVLLRATEELTTRAQREGKRIRWEGLPEEPVLCDLAWTSEAVGNLVKNALDLSLIHIFSPLWRFPRPSARRFPLCEDSLAGRPAFPVSEAPPACASALRPRPIPCAPRFTFHVHAFQTRSFRCFPLYGEDVYKRQPRRVP